MLPLKDTHHTELLSEILALIKKVDEHYNKGLATAGDSFATLKDASSSVIAKHLSTMAISTANTNVLLRLKANALRVLMSIVNSENHTTSSTGIMMSQRPLTLLITLYFHAAIIEPPTSIVASSFSAGESAWNDGHVLLPIVVSLIVSVAHKGHSLKRKVFSLISERLLHVAQQPKIP